MSLANKVKTAILAGVLAITGAGAALMPAYAYADDNSIINGGSIGGGVSDVVNGSNLPTVEASSIVQRVINIILYVVGVLSVVMIIIGGIRYTASAGDQAAVTKAKNTILYGIVGLVIALLAYAIINFVLKAVGVSI